MDTAPTPPIFAPNPYPRAEPGRLLTAIEIAPRRVFPIVDMLIVQFLAVAGIILAFVLKFPWWQGAIAGLVVSLPFVIRSHGVSMPRALVARLEHLRARRSKTRKRRIAEPFDVPLGDQAQIGFRWDGRTLLSLLKIEANPQALTVMEPGTTVSGETVSLALLAECLKQFDVSLDSIDVISQGARSSGHTYMATVYDAVLGPLPAIAQRNVWIAVRFDPSRCADAVGRRGGSRAGILRTATTATRRVANRLTEAGLRTRILTATEIAHTTSQLADGVNLLNLDEDWTACHEGNFRLSSYAFKGNALTTAGLGVVWTIPSYSTTVCVSLQNASDEEYIKIRGLVRFDGHGLGTQVNLAALTPLHGQQYNALIASLPLPQPKQSLGHWVYGRELEAFQDLALPASGCGQVLGADAHGRAVALPIFGPQIRRVEVAGELHLAQQAVLRGLALGARVLVHTRRPAMWRQMVEAVSDSNLLWVTELNRGAMQAGWDRNYSVAVFDGVIEQAVRVGMTTMVVMPPKTIPSGTADVSLEQLDEDSDAVKVSTSAGSAIVTMVATDEELRYLTASFYEYA